MSEAFLNYLPGLGQDWALTVTRGTATLRTNWRPYCVRLGLNGTHQLPVHADDVTLLSENISKK
jgi:hypothetical protein